MAQSDHHRPQGVQANSAEDEFELIRHSFKVRLQSEQARLEALAQELGAAGDEVAPVLVDIGTFAHRLRGAAAVFDLPELSSAAKALELAATCGEPGRSCDPSLWPTLKVLADKLVAINAGTGISQ